MMRCWLFSLSYYPIKTSEAFTLDMSFLCLHRSSWLEFFSLFITFRRDMAKNISLPSYRYSTAIFEPSLADSCGPQAVLQCGSVAMWPPGSVARSSSANERPALLRQSPLSFSPLLLLAAKLFVCNRSYLYVENIKMMSGSLNKSSCCFLPLNALFTIFLPFPLPFQYIGKG